MKAAKERWGVGLGGWGGGSTTAEATVDGRLGLLQGDLLELLNMTRHIHFNASETSP